MSCRLCCRYVLDNVPKLVHTMREANVTIRWLMLHSHNLKNPANKKAAAVRAAVLGAGFNPKQVFSLLLNTAQYEFVMKEMFSESHPCLPVFESAACALC